jgi:hypothetical protein
MHYFILTFYFISDISPTDVVLSLLKIIILVASSSRADLCELNYTARPYHENQKCGSTTNDSVIVSRSSGGMMAAA